MREASLDEHSGLDFTERPEERLGPSRHFLVAENLEIRLLLRRAEGVEVPIRGPSGIAPLTRNAHVGLGDSEGVGLAILVRRDRLERCANLLGEIRQRAVI